MMECLHLISDASQATFPSNKPSSFSCQLPEKLHFSEPMCVCLNSIEFDNLIANVDENKDKIILFDFFKAFPPGKPPNVSDRTEYGFYSNISLKTGAFSNPHIICEKLNSKIRNTKIERLKGVQIFSYDDNLKKFNINVKDLNISLIIRQNWISIFGLSGSQQVKQQYVVLGRTKENDFYYFNKEKRFFLSVDKRRWASDSLTGGLASFPANFEINSILSIHLAELKAKIYGDRYAKILKTFESRQENTMKGDRIHISFPTQDFCSLSSQTLSVLHVSVTNSFDEAPIFMEGNIVLFLSFRPQRLVF